jgi:hypothetical protein
MALERAAKHEISTIRQSASLSAALYSGKKTTGQRLSFGIPERGRRTLLLFSLRMEFTCFYMAGKDITVVGASDGVALRLHLRL